MSVLVTRLVQSANLLTLTLENILEHSPEVGPLEILSHLHCFKDLPLSHSSFGVIPCDH